ncbi:zinc ribbon domain-containing protein [Leucobacter triazinivorans]
MVGDAAWEPLISESDFARLQTILFDPARRIHHHDGVTPKALLSHIAKCHYCGRALAHTTNKNRSKNGGPRARRYACRFRGCMKVMIASEWLDEYVSAAAVAWLSRPDSIAALSADDDSWHERSVDAEKLTTELQARLDDATDQFIAGAISAPVLARIESTLRPQIEEAQKAATPTIVDDGVRNVLTAEDIQNAWDNIGLLEQRRILKLLFDIRITQAPRHGPNSVQPERVIISPRTPDRG